MVASKRTRKTKAKPPGAKKRGKTPRVKEVYDRIQGLALSLGAQAMDGDGVEEIEKLAAVVSEVTSKLRDSVNFVHGAALADWAEVFQADPAKLPADPASRVLWILARAWDTVEQIEDGSLEDAERALRAWRSWRAVVQAEPLDVRLEAARKLQEARKDFVRRPGPEPQKATPRAPGLRM